MDYDGELGHKERTTIYARSKPRITLLAGRAAHFPPAGDSGSQHGLLILASRLALVFVVFPHVEGCDPQRGGLSVFGIVFHGVHSSRAIAGSGSGRCSGYRIPFVVIDPGLVFLLWSYLQSFPACPVEGYVTSEYGMRTDPITHRRRWHRGLDVGAPEGTPIRSLWNGHVVSVRKRSRGYGNSVLVRSGTRLVRFAHMHEVFVERGEEVQRGEVIGSVGESGRATGPHLHLEMWEHRKTRDPRADLHLCFYN